MLPHRLRNTLVYVNLIALFLLNFSVLKAFTPLQIQVNLVFSFSLTLAFFRTLKKQSYFLLWFPLISFACAFFLLFTNSLIRDEEQMNNVFKLKLSEVNAALDRYKLDLGEYPPQSEGLGSLIKSGKKNWKGPYIDETKLYDDFGTGIKYISYNNYIKLTSAGPDRQFETDDDIIFENETKER